MRAREKEVITGSIAPGHRRDGQKGRLVAGEGVEPASSTLRGPGYQCCSIPPDTFLEHAVLCWAAILYLLCRPLPPRANMCVSKTVSRWPGDLDMPSFEPHHPFFAEALSYATTQVCLTFAHYLRSGESPPTKSFILNRGRVVDSILRNTDEVLLALSSNNLPSLLIYDEADASNIQSGQRAPDYIVPLEAWNMISQVCIGSAFERVSSRIRSSYGKDRWNWPRELEYFYHVRNGCFHGNAFNPRYRKPKKSAIDPSHPPAWRTSILVDDASIKGEAVFGGILASGDVPILLGDIAELLQ